MTGMIGADEIMAAMAGQVQLAAKGIAASDFQRWLGYDPDAIWEVAREAADEEFAVLPGMPVGVSAEGRLRKLRSLSRAERDAVKEALADTFVLAFFTAVSLERAKQITNEKGASDADV